jgi:hypothetical protein
MPILSDRGDCYGTRLASNRFSIWEMAANVLCGVLLLAVLLLAGYDTCQLFERQERRFIDYPVWHEPLNSWSL